jgi:PAS domain S-box-containing protein
MRPWRHANGTIGGILIFSEDVTARVEMERTLHESRADLDRAQAVARTGSWRFDINRKAFTGSAEAFRIFGNRPGTPVTFESFLAAVHPDDREHVDRSWLAALKGAPYDIEFRITVDKETKWLRGRAELEYDPAGNLLGSFGSVQDITDKKEAEDRLRQSEARYRMLHETLRDPFVQASMDGRIIEFNDLYCQMLGYSPDEVRALTYQELTPERWHDYEEGIVQNQIIPHGYSDVYEKEYRRKDGTIFPVELRTILSRDTAGRPHSMWAIVRDISGRKQAEEALRASEERYRGIFEHAGIGIAISSLEGRIMSFNPAFSAMLGYTEDELCGHAFVELIHPEDRETNLAEIQRLIAQHIPSIEITNRYISKSGKPIWVRKHVSLLSDASGKPTNFFALVTDITERKRQEEQIKLLMREVNHRSKNILTVVQAIARQTVAVSPDDFIDRFGRRIEALAAGQDLLVENKWRGANLDELVRSQLAHFKDLIGQRIRLRGPPVFVSAHAAQTIGLIMHELATNAGKYGALLASSGQVEIEWSLNRREIGKETVVLCWRESGGPMVNPPTQRGFGSTVLCDMATLSLNAKVELDFSGMGLSWRLECPASEVMDSKGSA